MNSRFFPLHSIALSTRSVNNFSNVIKLSSSIVRIFYDNFYYIHRIRTSFSTFHKEILYVVKFIVCYLVSANHSLSLYDVYECNRKRTIEHKKNRGDIIALLYPGNLDKSLNLVNCLWKNN